MYRRVATVLLLLLGLALVVGDDRAEVIGPVEAALLLVAAIALTLLLFSRRVERTMARYVFPLGRRVHLDRPLASVWSALQCWAFLQRWPILRALHPRPSRRRPRAQYECRLELRARTQSDDAGPSSIA